MLKSIPLHSLVITVGPAAASRETLVARHFPEHEIVSARRIARELVGETDRPDLNSVVFGEARRRALLKLELGERAVIDAANLRREDRVGLARIGLDAGVPVFYLVCDPRGASARDLARFTAAEHEIAAGDGGLVEVIDGRIDQPDPLDKAKPNLAALRRTWSGVTVVGDVHGMREPLLAALAWARSRRHYLIFLGDVVDYGPDTLEVADEIHRVVMHGDGELILGNHERKIARWIGEHADARLSDGNRVTTQALARLDSAEARRWQTRFKGLVARASPCRHLGNMVFAHAAVHPGYWRGTVAPRDLESMALFGEFVASPDGQRPARTYGWVNTIPSGTTVLVGHDIRSTRSPLVVGAQHGGTAVFMDTGSGKGGRLASADLKFVGDGFRIENFNLH